MSHKKQQIAFIKDKSACTHTNMEINNNKSVVPNILVQMPLSSIKILLRSKHKLHLRLNKPYSCHSVCESLQLKNTMNEGMSIHVFLFANLLNGLF